MNKHLRNKINISKIIKTSKLLIISEDINPGYISPNEAQISKNESIQVRLRRSGRAILKKIFRPFTKMAQFFLRPFLHRFRFFMTEIILEEVRKNSSQNHREINENFDRLISYKVEVILQILEDRANHRELTLNQELYAIQNILNDIKIELKTINSERPSTKVRL